LTTYMSSDAESFLSATDLAYEDVRNAFLKFLRSIKPDAPFILASHSQGTMHSKRLLLEVIDADVALAKRLVAAYLIGSAVTTSLVQSLKHVRTPSSTDQTNVVIGYDTVPLDFKPTASALQLRRDIRKARLAKDPARVPWLSTEKAVASNPLEWCGGRHLGFARLGKNSIVSSVELRPDFAGTARSDGGYLWCGRPSEFWPDNLPVPNFVKMIEAADSSTLHNLDYSIWYFNIRANVEQRVRSYCRGRQSKL